MRGFAKVGAWVAVALLGVFIEENAAMAEDGGIDMLVFIGTYADEQADGIFACRLDGQTGELTRLSATSGVANPSFLAIHPNKRFLYAVSEVGRIGDKATGGIVALSIDSETGGLTELNRQLSLGGAPCHIVVEPGGRSVLVANYSGGNVTVAPIAGDGSLEEPSCIIQHEGSSVNPSRQKGPHAHSINLDGRGAFAVAADLGIDKLMIYRLTADGRELVANENQPFAQVAPGAGPRHFSFHPNDSFAYVINELDSTITAFHYDAVKGMLAGQGTVSTLLEGFEGNNSTAEIVVHPNGRFVYGSNRGHDSIAIFSVDQRDGSLKAIGHEPTGGKTPRNFAIEPTGRFLLAANQQTDNVVVFRIDGETGKLKRTEHEISVPKPVCIRFLAN